ncbi:MAG: DNA polymerase IV [Firmicutes bacterium HGW-Firmicutes-7]|nr:MAG: DNA polymerase IV [Firmicutes bacterium HGW-Firmicutes-7]
MKNNYERQILHIDMNAFFASCEQAMNSELRKAPLIVGGDPEKRAGIVLAASYDAKRCGVKTTMTLYEAAKLCPNAIFINPSSGLYDKMSKQVMEIFGQYTPAVEQVSIDEAFLDMTGTESLFGDILQVAEIIQQRILQELELPCSVGISSNKLLAKMASDYKKPMGITTIYPHEIQEKLWPLKVSDLYGVGKKSVIKLNQIGVKTIGDLAKIQYDILINYFGNSMAQMMIRHAQGIGDSKVESVRDDVKSVGNELTFPKDLTQLKDICRELLVLSDKVGYRLRKNNLKGKTISIKVKYFDFKVITRAKTIDVMTDSTDCIYQVVRELIIANQCNKPIRLLGVMVSNFDNEDIQQLSLFNQEPSTNKLDGMVDEIRKKHGYGAVKRATILGKKNDIDF